jgi:hypothetical protein
MLARQPARVRLDGWEHMTHDVHAPGDTLPQGRQAPATLRAARVWARTGDARAIAATNHTEVGHLGVSQVSAARVGA